MLAVIPALGKFALGWIGIVSSLGVKQSMAWLPKNTLANNPQASAKEY